MDHVDDTGNLKFGRYRVWLNLWVRWVAVVVPLEELCDQSLLVYNAGGCMLIIGK